MHTDRSASAGGVVFFQLMESLVTNVAVIAAGELGVVDALAGGPRDSDDLAQVTGSHPPSLRRLLRLLAAAGIVTQPQTGRYSLTEAAASLQATTGSLQPLF
jgi:DNA-binding IclR family transcriptional regulator